jgi:hypothetical protein
LLLAGESTVTGDVVQLPVLTLFISIAGMGTVLSTEEFFRICFLFDDDRFDFLPDTSSEDDEDTNPEGGDGAAASSWLLNCEF